MRKDDLIRLKRTKVIRGFEVLEEDSNGNVTGLELYLYSEPNKATLSALLRKTYDRIKRSHMGSIGSIPK